VGKLLFWIIIGLVALTVARIVARSAASRPADAGRPQSRRGAAKTPPAEQMVRCAHCGIHLPRSEALLLGGHTWCSQDHARLGVNKN
jgi:uncharacterized protein